MQPTTRLNGAAKARNYHSQLQAMLQGLQHVQTGVDSRLQNVKIYIVLENVCNDHIHWAPK
jgi:hypothetical protein